MITHDCPIYPPSLAAAPLNVPLNARHSPAVGDSIKNTAFCNGRHSAWHAPDHSPARPDLDRHRTTCPCMLCARPYHSLVQGLITALNQHHACHQHHGCTCLQKGPTPSLGFLYHKHAALSPPTSLQAVLFQAPMPVHSVDADARRPLASLPVVTPAQVCNSQAGRVVDTAINLPALDLLSAARMLFF